MVAIRTDLLAYEALRALFVALLLWATTQPAASKEVTYNGQIAPILWKNCAGCHRAGEVGPFALMTYEDASKRADFIADITASRRMPPWKAEPNFGKFHDERRLSEEEIALIAK